MRLKKAVNTLSAGISAVLQKVILLAASLKALLLKLFFKQKEAGGDSLREQQPEEKDNPDEIREEQRKILVSYCLYGDRTVRHDGKDISLDNSVFLKWKKEGRLVPVCPEVEGGLTVPRLPSERKGRNVIRMDERDVTEEFREGAIRSLQYARKSNVAFAIMKEGSPSCGSTYIHDGRFTGQIRRGEGVTVEKLRNAGIIVFNENELQEAAELLTVIESDSGNEEAGTSEIRRRSGIMRG